jgi:transcriptional regulator with XRE-family HTH domain
MISLHEQIQSQLCSFGARLQELRLRRNWTLQELADRSGLSKAFLSRLESGDRQASIAAVLTLSRIFDVSLASLFESELATDPCVIVRKAEAIERTVNGLAYVPLSRASRFFNLQPIRVRVSRSRRGDEHFHHEGEEWIYLLSGQLTLSLAGNTYNLAPGDAAHFDSRLPHRLIARGSTDAEVLLVASPLSESAPVSRSTSREWRAIPRLGLMDISFSESAAGKARSSGQETRGQIKAVQRNRLHSPKSPKRNT